MQHYPLRELINKATTTLTNARVDSPRLSAEVLLAHSLGIDSNTLKLRLITEPERIVSPQEAEVFFQLCQERARGVPVAYLTGVKEFFGLEFAVTPATLIPRPDTELLVELALATARKIEQELWQGQKAQLGQQNVFPPATHTLGALCTHHQQFRFADLGTGTGCIAICLALNLKNWHGTALDISPKALEVAKANAKRHKVSTIDFLRASFQSLALPERSLHMLVSNPPYISSAHYQTLDHEVTGFEPQSALTPGTFEHSPRPTQKYLAIPSPLATSNQAQRESQAGYEPVIPTAQANHPYPAAKHESNGLEDFFTIIEQAERLLLPGGYLLCEMGFDQAEALSSHLQKRHWSNIVVHKDLADHNRVIQARWSE